MENKILILGVGNILLSDEGFGVRAMEYLQKNYVWPDCVELQDGATRGLLLMAELLECDLVVVLDAMLGGEKPGTIYFIDNENLRPDLRLGQSMHQTSLEDVLISCDLAGHRPEAMVFGFEPFDWQTPNVGLTPRASEILPIFCEKVVAELAKRGITPDRL